MDATPTLPLSDCPEYRAELARLATERSMKNPIHAEVIPNTKPTWHVLRVEPGRERTTAAYLAERRFGTYLPEFERTRIARGRKTTRMLPMFPCYLFVFVWGIDRHWRRIESCPGVMGALFLHGDDMPAAVPDRIMDHIQAAETELRLHGGVVERGHVVERKKKRPRRKKRREPVRDPDLPPGIELGPTQELVTISTKSYFADVGMLDEAARNSLLMKALGLTSQAALSPDRPASVNGR
jgi:transcription antitermination factor NusG